MKPIAISGSLLLISLLSFAGCADQDYPDVDYGRYYQNAQAGKDAGQCVDIADCNSPVNKEEFRHVYSAQFEGNESAEISKDYVGYYGVIDGECHEWYKDKDTQKQIYAGDMDYIELDAKPGTPLVVDVVRVPGHKTQPIVTLRNSDGIDLVYSGTAGAGMAQISFLMPGTKAYIAIEDAANYAGARVENCSHYSWTGGDKYHYVLTVKRAGFSLEQSGTLKGDTEVLSMMGSLPAPGSTQYYSIKVPPGADFSVELVPNAAGYRTAITPVTGNYDWIYAGTTTLAQTQELTYTKEDFKGNVRYDDQYEKYIFAVSDLDANYGYSYTIKARVK